MGKNRSKRAREWGKYAVMIILMLTGGAYGVLVGRYLDAVIGGNPFSGKALLSYAFIVILIFAALYAQIILHEAGHLLFGRLTGYRFSSFRVGGLMWMREGGRLRVKRLTVAGTGGQCLMIPPDMKDGRIPYRLYNFGGVIVNGMFSLICYLACLLCGASGGLPFLFMTLCVTGLAFTLTNGIPMRMNGIGNDGMNALSIGKSEGAMRAFWMQLRATEQAARGARYKDMPEEWFFVPTEEDMKNSMTAVMGVACASRLMDAHAFEEAVQMMRACLSEDSAVGGVHRRLMACDLAYCELIGENRASVVEGLLDGGQRKFMKTMKAFPTVLRTEYAYALLALKDGEAAERLRAQFDKRALTYPYPGDIEGERELMEIAKRKAGDELYIVS